MLNWKDITSINLNYDKVNILTDNNDIYLHIISNNKPVLYSIYDKVNNRFKNRLDIIYLNNLSIYDICSESIDNNIVISIVSKLYGTEDCIYNININENRSVTATIIGMCNSRPMYIKLFKYNNNIYVFSTNIVNDKSTSIYHIYHKDNKMHIEYMGDVNLINFIPFVINDSIYAIGGETEYTSYHEDGTIHLLTKEINSFSYKKDYINNINKCMKYYKCIKYNDYYLFYNELNKDIYILNKLFTIDKFITIPENIKEYKLFIFRNELYLLTNIDFKIHILKLNNN